MGLVYDGPKVCAQIFEMNKMLRNRIGELDHLKETVLHFIDDNHLLGKAYDSTKEYYQRVWIPVLEGIQEGCQSMIYGNTAFEHAFVCTVRVINETYLNSDCLDEAYEKWMSYVTNFEHNVVGFDGVTTSNLLGIKDLEEIQRLSNALHEFDLKSAKHFDESIEYFREVAQGLDLIESDVWDGTSYNLTGKSMSWAVSLHNKASLVKLSDREQAMLLKVGYACSEIGQLVGAMNTKEFDVFRLLANENYTEVLKCDGTSNCTNVVDAYMKKIKVHCTSIKDMTLFEKAQSALK